MNYINSIRYQELYLGEKKKNNYFEGWYFKHVDKNALYSISFIVGISKSNDSHSFIQIIDNIKNKSYYLRFDVDDFSYSSNPFYIKIKNNFFSLEKIQMDIKKPKIKVDVSYDGLTPIKRNIYAPNIMGPFAYIPFMECYHAVISLSHRLSGYVKIYNKKIAFDDGIGYIEKDYGKGFPNKYLWLHANNHNGCCLFLSVANIPFIGLNFDGLICILNVGNKVYQFATYYFGTAHIDKIENRHYFITIKQGSVRLIINLFWTNHMKLLAPQKGDMNEYIKESLNSICDVELYIKKEKVFNERFVTCSSEVFNY